jgi:cleavage stimulation factor subunit 3
MNAIRKVYIRAVQIPVVNIDELWTELEAFDMNFHDIAVTYFLYPIVKLDYHMT